MSIKILTPISHLFNDKYDGKKLASLSDELEARERTCDLNFPNTTHYHIDFDVNIGLTNDQIVFLENHVKPRENIHTLTFQAARDCQEVELRDNRYFPKSKPLDLNEQIENTKKSINQIKNIVGSFRNIGIENNNFYDTGAYGICTTPEFLTQACLKTDCHLLFDFAHAFVTCINRKLSFEDYKNELLNNINCKQIHLCEPTLFSENGKEYAIDSHNLPSSVNTKECIDILRNWKIQYLTIEYYKDVNGLIRYLPYLRDLLYKK